ncbi:MAG: phage integrase N-terminal domain-containing protein [Haliea sp.]
MRDLDYSLRQMVKKSREGSFGTRAARQAILLQAAKTLHELGYRKMRPESIKPKHVQALVEHWKEQKLTPGTIKNRLSQVRWWAGQVQKPAVVARDNDHYGIERRRYVTGEDKSKSLDGEKLGRVRDEHTKLSLQLQAAFGLRREESIKFSPAYADRGDRIVLKASWTKGGKSREIPIRNDEQRELLNQARRLVGRGSLIPVNKNYIQQLRTYERASMRAGLDKNHGLRHAYAQRRYEEITGWKCPAAGGQDRRALSADQRNLDKAARELISRELGHERVAIVAVYCG